jgi:multisubunit Na+/H+ antiporter MnhC subunit
VDGVIDEEASYESDEVDQEQEEEEDEEEELPVCCAVVFCAVVLVFAVACLVVWGVARRYKPTVVAKVHYIDYCACLEQELY